jgi:hypothetical protein
MPFLPKNGRRINLPFHHSSTGIGFESVDHDLLDVHFVLFDS